MKEDLFRGYFNALPVQAFVKDTSGKYLYVNPRFADMHGIAAGDISQQGYTDSSFPSRIQATSFPVKDAQGETIAIGGFALPAESRKTVVIPAQEQKTETIDDETQEQRELLPLGDDTLFTNMQLGAVYGEIITDENENPIDFKYLAMNPAFQELTGLEEKATIGRRVTDVLPDLKLDPTLLSREDEGWIAQFGRVALEGYTWRFDRKWCNGVKKWVGGIAYRPHGQEGRFVSLFLNVSESVKVEEALRESEERHRNLFECMMQGVVYQDSSGMIIAANPSAERILGLTLDQMMGRTSVDPRWKSTKEDGSDFPGDQHPAMVALKTGKPVTGVIMGVFHPTNEKHHWIIIDSIPRFKPGETEPFQVYSTFTDMTETKEFERKLLKEKERAEMADMLKSAFLANMSHEIRTPLNGVLGHIDLAVSNGLSKENRQENLDGLNVARQSGELLLSIIQDILDLSKIEAGQLAIKHDEQFQLRNLVSQVARLGSNHDQSTKEDNRLRI